MLFLKAYFLHYLKIFKVINYDFVFIHREILPVGPPILEWFIAKILRKKIIYDFDDAIWNTDLKYEPRLQKILKWRSKVASICKWSYKVSCGNEYLCSYALQYNSSVVLNPTTIDTDGLHNPALYAVNKNQKEIIIGWTGTHSTLKYLHDITPILKHLETTNSQVRFVVIADKKPDLDLKSISFVPWSKEHEGQDLMKFDIGIMPLTDDKWSQGKCGFKALQYMALGIPCVASPVGVNKKIIDHASNGFLCTTSSQWQGALSTLISDVQLRKEMGVRAREKVIKDYSVDSNAAVFLSLFQ